MTNNQGLEVPTPGKGDLAHAAVKGALSLIPWVGGPAVELFQNVVQPPLEKRRAAWMRDVGEKLKELQDKGVNIERLQDDENFISVVMQASQAALRTHKAEKLAALRNAVINVGLGQSPEETVQHLLLNFIDELSAMHLCILRIFRAPQVPTGLSMGGLSNVLEHNIPELRGQRELYQQLWKDLYSRGLVSTENLGVTMSSAGLAERRTTRLGEQLLEFISEAGA